MEVERLLKEEMRKHQVKFDTVDSKYVYKMNWLKEKAGIKINRLEKHISENFEKNRLDLDRVKMTLEDEYSTQREENAKEAADVLGYVDEDDIKDPEMVLKKYKEISAVKKILVKKLAHAEQFVNTLDLKLRNHVRSNKELSQQNKSFTNNMKMLNYCFLMLVERSRLIGDHKEKCRSLISEENYDVLEQLFNNNELLDSPLQEFLIKRLYDVRESLNILSLSTNEEATRMRVSKLISEIKVESMLTENEKERYDRFLNWQQVLQEKMQFERKPKSKSNIQSKSPNRFRRETKNTRRHADKETSVGAQSDYVLTNATPNLSVSKNQNYLQINSYMPKTTLIHTNLSSPRGPDALERAYKEIDEEMKSSTLPLKYNSKESFGNVLKSVDMEEANSVPLESPSTFYTERPSNPQSDFLNTERHELEKETTESSESDKSQEEEEEDPVLPSTSKIKRHDYHPNSFEGKLISSLYAPLLLKNKLPRKFDFKDFLALEINEGQRVKELIISALHNTVAKKENKHSQTEIDLDTIKNHRISQKEQVLREINEGKYRPEREKKKSLEQLFQVQSLTKYYTAKKELDDGKYSLDKEILKRAVYAAGKYEIQYDKESQRIGAMPEGEESDRIWEMVITKRVNDRRKDLVTNYLCNFLGTDMFAAKANEMIQLLKHHNIYKLTHTIQTFKPLQNQSFKRWSRLMLGLFRQQAKSIGRKVEEHNTTDVMEV